MLRIKLLRQTICDNVLILAVEMVFLFTHWKSADLSLSLFPLLGLSLKLIICFCFQKDQVYYKQQI